MGMMLSDSSQDVGKAQFNIVKIPSQKGGKALVLESGQDTYRIEAHTAGLCLALF